MKGRTVYAAVYYEIEINERNLGDVRIWSPGWYRTDVNGDAPVVQLQMRIRNDSDSPIQLDFAQTYVEFATGEPAWYIEKDPARIADKLHKRPLRPLSRRKSASAQYTLPAERPEGPIGGIGLHLTRKGR